MPFINQPSPIPDGTAPNRSMAAAAPPPWVILDRVARVQLDDEQHPGKTSVSLAAPPRLSTLTVPRSIHPNPGDHDKLPFIVSADTAVLLLHIRRPPLVVTDLSTPGTLFVVRDFVPVHGVVPGDATASATRLPNRADQPTIPPISNIKHVGVVSHPARPGVDYIVAELKVFYNNDRARLLYFRSGATAWAEKELVLPLAAMPCQIRKFDGVVSHDGKLWWFNLRWGVLSCDPFDDHPVLRYKSLPVDHDHAARGVEMGRLVTVSHGLLRYVEVSRHPEAEATTVFMSGLASYKDMQLWTPMYTRRFEEIWASDSYKETGMPEEVPVLAAMHPSNPLVLYFFLREYVFGVDMSKRRVVHSVHKAMEVNSRSGVLMVAPPLWRNVLAWKLPPSLSQEHGTPDHRLK